MQNLRNKVLKIFSAQPNKQKNKDNSKLQHRINALYAILKNLYGPEQLVAKAHQLKAIDLVNSKNPTEQILGLERLIYNNVNFNKKRQASEYDKVLGELEQALAEIVAYRKVEETIERRVQEVLQERQKKYVQDIRKKVLAEKDGPETEYTRTRLEQLEKLEERKLARSATEIVRPQAVEEIVGQEAAVKALMSRLSSPFPQHMILYGPPGVGKTTAARLALEAAKKLEITPFGQEAPFLEIDGTTLRWDPRGITNPLLGSVHDPVYQGARRDLAEVGIPEPKPGLVTEASGGVLFIDEIGEMDPVLQNKLLKVLEDKRVFFESSYFDSENPKVPEYIKKLFKEGAPADFVLISATTRRPHEINPAIRSRAAEIFFSPLDKTDICQIVKDAADRLQVSLEAGVAELISEYTIEGRRAVNLLIDAYSMVAYQAGRQENLIVTKQHMQDILQAGRHTHYVRFKASDKPRIGQAIGLGVYGYLGSAMEIECAVFKAATAGKGQVRFNETAGSMAKDSVYNAAAVLRKLNNIDLANYDVHVNVIGGGNIDGPSAGVAIALALYSALTGQPLRQDVAVTGEISIQGHVKPVGGVQEKIYGARQAGIKKVLIPADNEMEVPTTPSDVEVIFVSDFAQALPEIVVEG
ncbi:ATP-dependent protease, Lon family [Clostridium sp. 'deep sea']|uniref:Lon family ATP-dependent protease n=1 Tax=Clostridium sp. 'deep sea' TaxID=2779445 RepID=UPI00189695DE|nr:Lon family ATP-dependent protease [Clostridium sp. 'deep sea']QOR33874.1 ATP-dependent protease, Lon family [Clostridium sp. 'deep sea']